MMGVSVDFQEECHSAIIHENMTIYRLMVHDQQVEEIRSKMWSRDPKMARSFDGVSSESRFEMTYLDSKRGCQIKYLLSYLRLLMIGCPTRSLKRERVLVHQQRSLLVQSVERVILVSF